MTTPYSVRVWESGGVWFLLVLGAPDPDAVVKYLLEVAREMVQ